METARCKAFVAAVKHESFRGAAEELNYTTSAVSQLITALEEDLQVTLFHRSRKGVSMTSDGERMYPVIYNFIRQEERIYETAAEISGLLVGEITIAAYPSICTEWLPDIVECFKKKYPGVLIRIDDSIRSYVLESLNSGRADVGFLSDQHDFAGEWFELRRNPMVAVVGEDSPYADWEVFPIAECASVPMIHSSHGRDKDLDSVFAGTGIKPNIVTVTRNSFTAAALVQNNMGVLLVNELSTHMWNFRIKVLPLDPPRAISLGMAVSAMSTASPAVKAFVRFVRDYFREEDERRKGI